MDIDQLKQRIVASVKKLATLGNEYTKSKDEIVARKVLVKMFGEIAQQTLPLLRSLCLSAKKLSLRSEKQRSQTHRLKTS